MRLFTAICLDDETKNALFSAGKEAEKHSTGNFSAKENLHLTLVFIGETDRKDEVEKAISEIDFPSFEFKISGTGTFEKGIFWAGISENEKLVKLYKTVFEKLRKIGFEPEEREFVPHITLARKFRPEEGFSFSETEKILPQKTVNAKRISLMKSERIEGELKYTEIYYKELL